MTKKQLDTQALQKMASRLQENNRQLDLLNTQLDELIAKVEADIEQNCLTQNRQPKKN